MKKDFHFWGEKTIIVLAIIGTIFWINRFLPTKALTKNIYPTRCFGEWFGPERVIGEPNVSLSGHDNEFNSENSAFYQTGFQILICDGFKKIDGEFVSAKLGLSLAINEIKKEPPEQIEPEEQLPEQNEEIKEEEALTEPTEQEQEQEKEKIELLPELEEPSTFLKIKNFFFVSLREIISSLLSFLDVKKVFSQEPVLLEAPTSYQEFIPMPDDIFNLHYILGEKFYHLNTFSSYPISNATNNGYFYYDLPEVKSFADLENLKISFEGLLGGEPYLTVWLDSIWLEVECEEKPKVSLEVWQKFDGQDFEIFVDFQGKEIQLTDNNFEDKFPYSDGENEIVWQSLVNSRWQIFYLNLNDFLMGKKEPIQITQTSYNNISAKVSDVSDGKIVWQAWLDNNWEIMVANLELEGRTFQIERLTDNREHDMDPYFSKGEIFWQKKTEQGLKNFKAFQKENQWEILEIVNQSQ